MSSPPLDQYQIEWIDKARTAWKAESTLLERKRRREMKAQPLNMYDIGRLEERGEILSIINGAEWSGESLTEDIANLTALIKGELKGDERFPEYLMTYIKSFKGVKE
jgi:hypothetical protein